MSTLINIAALDNTWLLAAVWMALAFLGALLAIRFKISAALIEIVLGIAAGNFITLSTNTWIDFIAGFGSIMLTFLAGAEINPTVLRQQWRPAVLIGVLSFALPFAGAFAFALYAGHWSLTAAKVAGVAM